MGESIHEGLPPVFRLPEALERGLTRRDVRRGMRDRAVRRARRGVYATGPPAVDEGERWGMVRAEHLLRCREELARHPGHAVSHLSAAAVHNLAVPLHPHTVVHLTCIENVPRSRRKDGVLLHHCDSMANHTTVVDGIRVTTPSRTVADVLRTVRLPNGVAMLDQTLRGGVVSEAEVRQVLDGQRRWRGRPRALEALALVDPRRETWLESYSFVALHEQGLRMPLPQVEVLDDQMNFVARVDGLLDGVFLEADGHDKYFLGVDEQGVSPQESAARRIAAEEQRHEALERLGLVGARWTTREIKESLGDVTARVHGALRRADPGAFRGWVRWEGRLYRTPLLDEIVGPGWGV